MRNVNGPVLGGLLCSASVLVKLTTGKRGNGHVVSPVCNAIDVDMLIQYGDIDNSIV